MRRPIALVPDSISHETVECTKTLYEQALKGQLIGLAYAGVLPKNQFIVNTAGVAHRDPTLSRGMVLALDDELRQMVHSSQA